MRAAYTSHEITCPSFAAKVYESTFSAASIRPQTTHGTGIVCSFPATLGASRTTGSSTMSSWPNEEIPSVLAMRNSRTPIGAFASTWIFSTTDFAIAFGSFSLMGRTSTATPVPSISTLYAPAKFICPSTVTSAVVPR